MDNKHWWNKQLPSSYKIFLKLIFGAVLLVAILQYLMVNNFGIEYGGIGWGFVVAVWVIYTGLGIAYEHGKNSKKT